MNDSYTFDVHEDGVGRFTITRPAKLNALTKPVLVGLSDVLDRLEANRQVTPPTLIVTGQGERAFCAGTDLAEIQSMSAADRLAKNAMARDLLFRLSQSPVLSIAAVNGLAYGGGLELAMACTFRLAPPHVKLALPEIKLGLLPAYAGTQFLPALIGSDKALDMMTSGEPIDAQTGWQIGLVTRLADADSSLIEQAHQWACQINQMSRPAVDAIRRCVRAAGTVVSAAGLAVEDEQVRNIFQTKDAREGVAAFLEKRMPVFRHE